MQLFVLHQSLNCAQSVIAQLHFGFDGIEVGEQIRPLRSLDIGTLRPADGRFVTKIELRRIDAGRLGDPLGDRVQARQL